MDFVCYFETSALNYMSENLNIYDAIATNIRNKTTGNEYLISPVVIWELLLNGSEDNRERLIFFAQHFLNDRLLPSPSEIIVDYLKIKMGLSNNKIMATNLMLGKVWKDICNEKNRTFIFTEESKTILQEKSQYVREFSKKIRRFINEIEDENKILPQYDCDDPTMIDYLINFTIVNNSNLKSILNSNKTEYRVCKLATLLMHLFFLLNVDFDSTPIDEFWDSIGIVEFDDKLKFLVNNADKIIEKSPFLYMANMAIGQIEISNDKSRGLIFDCMHTLYLPYVDTFMTNDIHMINFKNQIRGYNGDKIQLISDVEWKTHSIEIDLDEFIKNNSGS